MRFPGLAVGFAPWALYLVMPHRLGEGALLFAGLVTAAVACALTRWTRGRSGIKLLGAAAVVTFTSIAAASLLVSDGVTRWFGAYSSGIVLFVLAAVMFRSLVGVPFTEQYSREGLPNEYWEAPRLHALNVRISLVWALCTLAAAVSVTIGSVVAEHNSSSLMQFLALSLSWLMPVLLMLIACRYMAIATGVSNLTL